MCVTCYVIATFTYFSCNPGNKKPFSSPITESILCVYIMFSLPHQLFLCNFNREAKETLITTFVSLLLLIASQCLQLWDTKWTRRKVSSRVHIHCVDSTLHPPPRPGRHLRQYRAAVEEVQNNDCHYDRDRGHSHHKREINS